MESGELIKLESFGDIGGLPKPSFEKAPTGGLEIYAIVHPHPDVRILPPGTYGRLPVLDSNKIFSFVIKSRGINDKIFLEPIGEFKELLSGVMFSNANGYQLDSHRYLISTYGVSPQALSSLDTGIYSYSSNANAARRGYLLPQGMPPFLAFTDCGNSEEDFNVKPIDAFTTEFVMARDLHAYDVMHKAGWCGTELAEAGWSPIYGYSFRVGREVFPYLDGVKYSKYRAQHLNAWGFDIQSLLPAER